MALLPSTTLALFSEWDLVVFRREVMLLQSIPPQEILILHAYFKRPPTFSPRFENGSRRQGNDS